MTEEQIKQNAEEYAELLTAGNKEHYRSIYTAAKEGYETGAHSLDEEIKEMKDELESLRKGFYERGDKLKELMLENNKLRNPWISVKERLPEKAIGLYELEEDEQHKMVLIKTANGSLYSGYLDAEEIWRAFTVPYKGAYPIAAITWSSITHWMPIPQIEKGE